jgi:hypothetical protein
MPRRSILAGGFHPRRTITEKSVRIDGRLLRPGENVRICGGPYAGRIGIFRGACADGRLIVNIGLGSFQTQLRVQRADIRHLEVQPTQQNRAPKCPKLSGDLQR